MVVSKALIETCMALNSIYDMEGVSLLYIHSVCPVCACQLATLIKWRKAQRGLEDPVKLKQFIPSQQSPAPKWSKNAVKKGSRRSKINNNDAVAKAASALVKSGVQTEIQRSTEESDPYNALLTHGILNELRQGKHSFASNVARSIPICNTNSSNVQIRRV